VTTITNYITNEEVVLIKKTWKLIRGINAAVVGDTFYSKLFALHPPLRRMFPRNMDEPYRMFMDMLNMIIARLDKQETLNQYIADITIRNSNYGIRTAHYKLAKEALIWTLQQGLGKDWTPATSEAWINGCSVVTDAMIIATSPVTK
jgi:hemoglobin-like flavoprotein